LFAAIGVFARAPFLRKHERLGDFYRAEGGRNQSSWRLLFVERISP
jgi:hypothetical protein